MLVFDACGKSCSNLWTTNRTITFLERASPPSKVKRIYFNASSCIAGPKNWQPRFRTAVQRFCDSWAEFWCSRMNSKTVLSPRLLTALIILAHPSSSASWQFTSVTSFRCIGRDSVPFVRPLLAASALVPFFKTRGLKNNASSFDAFLGREILLLIFFDSLYVWACCHRDGESEKLQQCVVYWQQVDLYVDSRLIKRANSSMQAWQTWLANRVTTSKANWLPLRVSKITGTYGACQELCPLRSGNWHCERSNVIFAQLLTHTTH